MSYNEETHFQTFLAVIDELETELNEPLKTVEEFQALEELDLSERGLTYLPLDLVLSLPPNVTTLALEKNGLCDLPETFGSDAASSAWGQLTELYLRNNALIRLPAAIGELSKLEGLYLEDNKLTSEGIPSEIAHLSCNLAGLCLHRNLLSVSNLQLQSIWLSDNKLS